MSALPPLQPRTPALLDSLDYERAEGIIARRNGRELIAQRLANYDDGRRRLAALSQPPLPTHVISVRRQNVSARRSLASDAALTAGLCAGVLLVSLVVFIAAALVVAWVW